DGVVAIGLDLYRDKGVGPQQQCLRETVRTNPKLVSIFNAAEGIDPIPGTPIRQQGYNDLPLDVDGVVRRDLVHVGGQGEAVVSLPMRLLEVGSGTSALRRRVEADQPPLQWLGPDAGGYYNTDAAGFQQMLPFARPGSFRQWTLQQLLNGQVPAAELRGTTVLIGSTAPSLRDLFQVPQTRFRAGASQQLMPGVEIHANRLASLQERQRQIAQGRPGQSRIWTADGALTDAIVLLAALLGALVTERVSPIRRGLLLLVLLLLAWSAVAVGLLLVQVWIELSEPLAALLLFGGTGLLRRGALAQQQRQQIQRLLGQTTSPAVANQLWNQREALLSDGRFEGRQLEVTAIFSDTRNFTTVSEGLAPAELLNWLNRGMAYCVPAISRRGGMVNKFTGDGFLAVFGAPVGVSPAADARAAVQTVLEIQQGMEQLNAELEADGEPAMALRIGVHSGPVLAGSMGSSERLEYAVIGDTVNCASRLESIDKTRHDNLCRVLVSSATRDLLLEQASAEERLWFERLIWLDWGSLQVKGRQVPLQIWELRGIAPAAAGATRV
ncbi:MAG: CHASE2 domain-containing protein, partial [Synechococcaceae bacterium WBB_3_034]|nr:CHASE2 domain-containing protein [Synechococcaceae bacterium WBB_3_034]